MNGRSDFLLAHRTVGELLMRAKTVGQGTPWGPIGNKPDPVVLTRRPIDFEFHPELGKKSGFCRLDEMVFPPPAPVLGREAHKKTH